MFPYRDENVTQRTPYMTVTLIAINILAWLFIQGAGQPLPLAESVCNRGLIAAELTERARPGTSFEMDRRLGLTCYTDPGRQPLNLVSSMFLHGSWLHLLGNMWFFWIFGNNIEDSMGHARFVVFYLLTGFAAALTQVLMNPGSLVPMVGASGAISGIMGGYLVLYPRVRVFALVPLIFVMTTVALPAWAMLAYWMVLQFFGVLESVGSDGGGVAFWAHVGGFFAGVVLIKLFARRDYILAHEGHWRPRRLGLGSSDREW